MNESMQKTSSVRIEEPSRLQMQEGRDWICNSFSRFFTDQGFTLHPPGPIIPESDRSVLFTGSTISTFKPHLESRKLPRCGLHMIQHCLRTHNAKVLGDMHPLPAWASYFTGIGALVNPECISELGRQTWEFFRTELEITKDSLRLRVCSCDDDLMKICRETAPLDSVEIDQQPEAYYRHSFGMSGVSGRNYNFAIANSGTGTWQDIGNFIIIESATEVLGAEIAFGVETILSRLWGLEHPILASSILDIVPYTNGYSLRLADALSASIVILEAGVRPVVTHRGRILRTYLQQISKLRIFVGATIDDIRIYAAEYQLRQFGRATQLSERLVQYLETYEVLVSLGHSPSSINKQLSDIFKTDDARSEQGSIC